MPPKSPWTLRAWVGLSGPIISISAGGLATAGTVYQNSSASVQGTLAGKTGVLVLTVLEAIGDNFGTYASDGLADDWQVQYFGVGNPAAAPGQDPDGDGHTNLFEHNAGLDPTSSLSVFKLRLETVPGQPNQLKLVFSPRLADRTYVVQYRLDLVTGPDWAPLTGSSQNDSGQERSVTDLNATEAMKFYRVEVTKP
jgi:hypothetical protein